MPDDASTPTQHEAAAPLRWDGPVDSDVDLHEPEQRREWSAHRWVLPTIAVGGMAGASARHALEVLWPARPNGFPWATFATNVSGCALIGLLMVYVVDLGAGHPLLRPFIGVGVLGGYTTFSTFAVQADHLIASGSPALALLYLFGSVAAAVVAVATGTTAGRWLLPRHLHLQASGSTGSQGTARPEEVRLG